MPNDRFIEVKCAYKRGHTGHTETGKARRVGMSNHLAETLSGLYKQRIEEALKEDRGRGIVETIFQLMIGQWNRISVGGFSREY
jgi:hypothetical protein